MAKVYDRIGSMSEAARMILDRYEIGCEFSGREFMNDVVRAYPAYKNAFGETQLRRLRQNRKRNGYEILCIKPRVSLYKKVKCKGAK